MKNFFINVLEFLGIFLLGSIISIYGAGFLSTFKTEYVALVLSIIFVGTLIFMALIKTKK